MHSDTAAFREIVGRLHAAEREHDVRILLAVESGSRAWGFPSPDSDFDARFVYVHRPEWYLSIDSSLRRDVIEYPIVDEMDVNGWDLRKALVLFAKSNPTIVEWIQSPIVYLERGLFHGTALSLLTTTYSCERGTAHYRSMAETNYERHIQSDVVSLKKYLYVLRPLLALLWIERYATAPPIEFRILCDRVLGRAEPRVAIDELVARKMLTPELGKGARIAALDEFIERELARLGSIPVISVEAAAPFEPLSVLFRDLLREAWT